MMPINLNLTQEEQAALFQAMSVEQLIALKGTPIKMNWSVDDLKEIAAFQKAEEEPHSVYCDIFQRMTPDETRNLVALKSISLKEKIEKTGLSKIAIETIENDVNQAIYGDILRYCKRLGIPKELLLESLLEETMV